MLGKLKQSEVAVSGSRPLAMALYLPQTIYPPSREALGAASPLLFSEKFATKFLKKAGNPHELASAMRFQPKSRRAYTANKARFISKPLSS
jgi:hypothetical protein